MENILNITEGLRITQNQLDLLPTCFNFLLCVAMSFVIRYFYLKRSFSLTGKHHIASVLPLLSSVVFIVIVIVKSSLALSLGLVGALSIVRFRTPIKEPEELVYLFLAISVGLGYAAGHSLITSLLTILTLAMTYLWLSNRKEGEVLEYNIVVNWVDDSFTLTFLAEILSNHSRSIKLIRFDSGGTGKTAVLLLSPEKEIELSDVIQEMNKFDPSATVSFYEAKTNW
ncbi:MAG: DUF4956 domain-containing protein [Candidatus Electrothrix sp. GW3-4]|uniref:DUF4956 domain-containing protein n=1 Tax=Candidatus Electrothrix sp. GW3-4 TaxID=3126740 RepID=UPI0030D59FFD